MTTQFCLDLFVRRQKNRNTELLLANIIGRYESPNVALNPYAKKNNTTGLPFTQYEINMRRKVEILKYDKSNNAALTQKKAWTQIVRGSSQRRTYSQSQIRAIQNGTGTGTANTTDDACPTLSTSAGIPGKAFYIQLDPNVPLYNYLTSNTYATRSIENTIIWTYTENSDILSNDPTLFTLFVGPAIDVNYAFFTFSVPIGLSVAGNSNANGSFTFTLPYENISVSVYYGGSIIAIRTVPVITFESEISGTTSAGNFNGQIYIGQLVVSNLGLSLSPGFVYEVRINYLQINNTTNINSFVSTMITGVKNSLTDSTKKTESGMVFTTAPASSSIGSFLISRE